MREENGQHYDGVDRRLKWFEISLIYKPISKAFSLFEFRQFSKNAKNEKFTRFGQNICSFFIIDFNANTYEQH